MFSFFKTTKKSPVVSPSEQNRADDNPADFVLIGGGGAPNHPGSLYPSAQLPAQPAPQPAFNRQYSLQYTSYTQNVPFKLNPVLSSNDTETEFLEFKLREITQIINQISSTKDYDFKLERSIVDP